MEETSESLRHAPDQGTIVAQQQDKGRMHRIGEVLNEKSHQQNGISHVASMVMISLDATSFCEHMVELRIN